MYDELIKRLRSHDGWALNKTLDEAADAIEALEIRSALNKEGKDLAIKLAETYKAICGKLSKPGWIPVTERLPSREGRYITAFSKGEVGENVFMIFRGAPAKWYYNSEDTGEVTHWMPLPEPPKEEI